MLIRSVPNPVVSDLGKHRIQSNEPPPSDPGPTPPPEKPKAKKVAVAVAYTSGGTMGGLVLGGIGGTLLSNWTGNPIFQQAGGAVGALAGAASGLVAAQSDKPGTLVRTLGAWTTATVGTGAGYYAGNLAGQWLASHGAAPFFGPNTALVAAMAGGVAGAAVAFTGHHVKSSFALKHLASAGLGATGGMMAGGAVQMALNAIDPNLSYMAIAAPFVGAVAGSLIGLSLYGHSNDPPPTYNNGYYGGGD